ncbi:hypothetical protein A6R68_13359, partial [Neotoma lepida]
ILVGVLHLNAEVKLVYDAIPPGEGWGGEKEEEEKEEEKEKEKEEEEEQEEEKEKEEEKKRKRKRKKIIKTVILVPQSTHCTLCRDLVSQTGGNDFHPYFLSRVFINKTG